MKTPDDIDVRSLRFAADVIEDKATLWDRQVTACADGGYSHDALKWRERAFGARKLAGELRSRATAAEKKQRAGLADEVLS